MHCPDQLRQVVFAGQYLKLHLNVASFMKDKAQGMYAPYYLHF